MNGNDFAGLSKTANEVSESRERRTDFTRRRLTVISMLGKSHDPVMTALVVLDCDIRTATRFIAQVRLEGIQAVYHKNLGEKKHDQTFEILRAYLARHPRGTRISSVRYVRWLKDQGINPPSERTVRWWMRELFRRKSHRSHRRSGKSLELNQKKKGEPDGSRQA